MCISLSRGQFWGLALVVATLFGMAGCQATKPYAIELRTLPSHEPIRNARLKFVASGMLWHEVTTKSITDSEGRADIRLPEGRNISMWVTHDDGKTSIARFRFTDTFRFDRWSPWLYDLNEGEGGGRLVIGEYRILRPSKKP